MYVCKQVNRIDIYSNRKKYIIIIYIHTVRIFLYMCIFFVYVYKIYKTLIFMEFCVSGVNTFFIYKYLFYI